MVSTGRFPLIGLPAWSPPLHVGVLLSVEEKGGKGRALGAGDGKCEGVRSIGSSRSCHRHISPSANPPTSFYHTNAGGGALSPGYFLLDFVPAEPTAPATALALLSGRRVPGVVRDKVRRRQGK